MKSLDKRVLREKVSDRILNDIEINHIIGASVLIRQKGEVLLDAHYGFADIERKNPISENSIFRIASMTKVISAVATMIVFERGLISFDDEIEKYLPEFSDLKHAITDENGKIVSTEPLKTPIRIHNLLTHTSLIDCGSIFAEQVKDMTKAQNETLESALDFYSGLTMENEPGIKNSYSGTVAFDILAGILQKETGKPIAEFIYDEITNPLGMKDTTFTPTSDQQKRMVEMHDKKDGKSVKHITYDGCVFEDVPATHTLAGAGLVSTIGDYDRFAQMLLNGGILEGVRIISPESVKYMGTPRIPQLEGSSNRWGYGVRVIDNETKILPVGCFGWSGAYGTHFWVDPENEITAVYMKNSKYDGGGSSTTARNFERDVVSSFIDR